MSQNKNLCFEHYITEEDVKLVVKNYFENQNAVLEAYFVDFASHNMLGFLCDYLKLDVHVALDGVEKENINCFIKCVSKSNEAKAAMVEELKLFDKELTFYKVLKEKIKIPGIKPWSPKLMLGFKGGMVFENLNTLGYRIHNKLETFDENHTQVALQTLARFHASTIVFEEKYSQELKRSYSINEEYAAFLNKGGYEMNDPWFFQCMNGALEAIKNHSKFSQNMDVINKCIPKWPAVWKSALDLVDASPKYRNVISHRDLWNNNLLFRYKETGGREFADDCLIVDFQAVRYHPIAGDLMLLLCCNLEKEYRERELPYFLHYYYRTLEKILLENGVLIANVITIEDLFKSAEEYRLWGLVATACLVPQFWMDDELTTKIFTDSVQFNDILSKDKAAFVSKMIVSDIRYRKKVLSIFEEIVTRYCL